MSKYESSIRSFFNDQRRYIYDLHFFELSISILCFSFFKIEGTPISLSRDVYFGKESGPEEFLPSTRVFVAQGQGNKYLEKITLR